MSKDRETLQGILVTRYDRVILVPLPRSMWKPFADADPETGLGPCCCRYCSADGSSKAAGAWDTLAIRRDPSLRGEGRASGHGADATWMVHAPELHGKQPLREMDTQLRSEVSAYGRRRLVAE